MTKAICLLLLLLSPVEAVHWTPAPRTVRYHPASNPVREHHTSFPVQRRQRRSRIAFGHEESLRDRPVSRGGAAAGNTPVRPANTSFEKSVEAIVNIFVSVGRAILPPIFEFSRIVVAFYLTLPKDAIAAQAGLVYCFAGGYYPTLFAALSAVQNCGWDIMMQACQDLADQAILAIDALSEESKYDIDEMPYQAKITQKTLIVLKTIDPVKINTAAGALYTTWMGVSTVLQREFARTITLSLTISSYLQQVMEFILAPPIYLCVPPDFHKWVPVLVGWICKAAAMSLAWRVQRVLTATTSAITGGLMFARALLRMWNKRFKDKKSKRSPITRVVGAFIRENHRETFLDEIIGLMVGGIGLYTQIGHGFDFKIPFPLSFMSWPFDIAEKWIQWQITKDSS